MKMQVPEIFGFDENIQQSVIGSIPLNFYFYDIYKRNKSLINVRYILCSPQGGGVYTPPPPHPTPHTPHPRMAVTCPGCTGVGS